MYNMSILWACLLKDYDAKIRQACMLASLFTIARFVVIGGRDVVFSTVDIHTIIKTHLYYIYNKTIMLNYCLQLSYSIYLWVTV